MSREEIAELFRVALTWTNGDKDRAEAMVKAHLKGRMDVEALRQAREEVFLPG